LRVGLATCAERDRAERDGSHTATKAGDLVAMKHFRILETV